MATKKETKKETKKKSAKKLPPLRELAEAANALALSNTKLMTSTSLKVDKIDRSLIKVEGGQKVNTADIDQLSENLVVLMGGLNKHNARLKLVENDDGHFYISIVKSILRIGGCIGFLTNPALLVVGLFLAEILGIVEELV